MYENISERALSQIAGISYIIIFFSAIYANFFVLESLVNKPLETVINQHMAIRFGIIAFMITVVFDVVVAWALHLLFRNNGLTLLSTLFRMMHAAIMGVAIFSLPQVLNMSDASIIALQVEQFNIIWLIGLFFFGIHLILLSRILRKPMWIAIFLALAGVMYMVDTAAHFILPGYDNYAEIFLMLVAIPSVVGEMSLAIWLLVKGGKG